MIKILNDIQHRNFSRIRSTTEDKDELDAEIKKMIEEDENEFLPRGKRGVDSKKVDFQMENEEGVIEIGAADLKRKEEEMR